MDDPPPVFAFRLQRGVKIPLVASPSGLRSQQLDFRPENCDLVVCSYPASGEDAVLRILLSLSPELGVASGHSDNDLDQEQTDRSGYSSDSNDSGVPYIQVHTTHLPFCRSRWNPRTRYILVVRNPKQVCVSYFYFYNKIFRRLYGRQPEENCSFNTFYRLFIAGKVAFGDYFVHVRSWLERTCLPGCPCGYRGPPVSSEETANLLIVTYEELESDFDLNVQRIAQFLRAFTNGTSGLERQGRVIEGADRTLLKSNSVDSTDGSMGAGGRKMGLAAGWESHFSREHRNGFDEWIRWNGNASIYNRFWFDAL